MRAAVKGSVKEITFEKSFSETELMTPYSLKSTAR